MQIYKNSFLIIWFSSKILNMISEKWALGLNVEKLQSYLKEVVLHKEITRQSPAFGGWSVLSMTGSYKDGWQQGHLLLKVDTEDEKKQQIKKTIPQKFYTFTNKTEICIGYMDEVIELVKSKGLRPARARIICLTAGMACSWHRDAPDEIYAVRLHIPIITNHGCFFETVDDREHMPADGSGYFIAVNREHRVVNDGGSDRFHLVMDVYDLDGVTKYHQYHRKS